MKLFPTRDEWRGWGLPDKLTLISTIVGILSFFLALIPFFPSTKEVNFDKKNVSDVQEIILEKKYELTSKTISIEYFEPDIKSRENGYENAMLDYQIKYPKVSFQENPTVEEKINEQIYNIYKKEFWIDFNNINLSECYCQIIGDFEIVYKLENLIGIKFDVYRYGTGAAHGNRSVISLNINLDNGEVFEFKDLFRSWSQESINEIVYQNLLSHDCSCISAYRYNVFDGNFNLSFYFKENDLIVVFGKYEVGCGACGPVKISINFDEIESYINPNGPLYLLKKEHN